MRASLVSLAFLLTATSAAAGDWTAWRGPGQSGVSDETGLPASVDPADATWTVDLPSRGTPVVHGDQVVVWGYEGTGADVVEVVAAFDLATGTERWRRRFPDFLSDIIYDRYSIGAPTVDPATGRIYVQTSSGVIHALEADGSDVWSVSMMDTLGRLTFPNGRTGAPVVHEGHVIVHGITANWGANGPARDRFYAFDKDDGRLVWTSTPGTGPKDSSWSTPVIVPRGEDHLLVAGTGCGHVVALDARTGEPAWRFRMSIGGVNVTPAVVGDTLLASHAKENLDSTQIGRTVALDLGAERVPSNDGTGVRILQGERWRNDLVVFSSSPVVVDDTAYLTTMTGELAAVDVDTGTVRWTEKLGADQLHASAGYADGRLWVPLREGTLTVLTPTPSGPKDLQRVQLEGTALGAPAFAHGMVLVATTERVYAWGTPTDTTPDPAPAIPQASDTVAAVRAVPSEVVLRAGEAAPVVLERLDPHGRVIDEVAPADLEAWIPPSAKVRSTMDARWADGALTAGETARSSAGAFKATLGGHDATLRGRTVPAEGWSEDFERYATTVGDGFAWPPLAWIGARFKWEVRSLDGDKVLSKTLDNMIFQRSTVFFGHPDARSYTLRARVRTDGTRRAMSTVGLVNQRYLIALKGNQRVLEVSSNQERLKVSVPFEITPGTWYHLVTRVDVDDDGVAHVRARVWADGEEEPEGWTLEVDHPGGHTHGAPGLFGFSPRNLHKVYVDDIALDDSEAP